MNKDVYDDIYGEIYFLECSYEDVNGDVTMYMMA